MSTTPTTPELPDQDAHFYREPTFWLSLLVLVISSIQGAGLIPLTLVWKGMNVANMVGMLLTTLTAHGYDSKRAAAKLEGVAKAGKPWWKRTEAILTMLSMLPAALPLMMGSNVGAEAAMGAVLAVSRGLGFLKNAAAVKAAVADPTRPAVR